MTYDEALAFWYERIDFERRSPKPGDLKLDRMRAVLRALGDPHYQLRIIHVAGTKGKGSTAAMLASILHAAGYRVGLFTSPHLTEVSERIQVDGVPIGREEITARLTEIAAAVAPLDQSGDPLKAPTFFEICTALGFLHFVCRRVAFAVVEVGLGGRFDSTNVCMPLISVITNISFDHMALLGDKLAVIAREKAGIIKQCRPVVASVDAPEALAVIEEVARDRAAPLIALGSDFSFDYRPASGVRLPQVQIKTSRQTWPWMELSMHGRHQAANAAGAVAVIEEMQRIGVAIDDAAVGRGLKNVRWPARLEVISQRPLVLLDCAHNVASAQALVETIRESFVVPGRKHLIMAASSDKQVAEMMQVLGAFFDHFHLTRFANSTRCLAPEQTAALLKAAVPGASISLHPTAAEAWQAARAAAGPDDLVAVSGSVFLAGELRPLLVKP